MSDGAKPQKPEIVINAEKKAEQFVAEKKRLEQELKQVELQLYSMETSLMADCNSQNLLFNRPSFPTDCNEDGRRIFSLSSFKENEDHATSGLSCDQGLQAATNSSSAPCKTKTGEPPKRRGRPRKLNRVPSTKKI
ncbi:hypothetical protein SUGI_1101740 [Cryptomeria japonica]|nr:hypothetical protein SUGI_1101740 [Cryptomeria japonica]